MTEILITSSVLIAVIALLRAILRDRIRPGLQYALWGLVLLRLLVPVSWFESPVSVADAADPIVRQVQQYSAENTRTVTFPVTMGEIPETGESNDAVARTYIAPLDVARWVWLGGTAILAAWFLFVNIRLGRKLSRERKIYSENHKVPVYVTKTLPSPCLYLGDIYLTEEAAADPARAEYIIAHELTHRRHLDGVWSALRVVCLAVWWFNPLVWLAAVLSRRDCELFCDAATVKRLGEEHRFDYGRTLLDLTAVNIRPGDLICSATTMSGSGKSLKERIARIARNRKTSVLLGVVVVLIAAITVGCTFSGGETEMFFEADPEISDPYATPAPVPVEEWVPIYDFAAAANGQDPRVNVLAETGLDELYSYYMEYMAFCGADTWDMAAEYCWMDSEYSKNLSLEHHKPVVYSYVMAVQPLCDDLLAILVDIQTQNHNMPHREILNFVGRVDGTPCVFRNSENIPDELQFALERLELAADTGEEESLGPVNGSYWDEVNEVFGPFLEPISVATEITDNYKPISSISPISFEDLVYSSDGWEFEYYDGWQDSSIAGPLGDATIIIEGSNGAVLYIFEGTSNIFIIDALYSLAHNINEGYCILATFGMSGDEMVSTLYEWAKTWSPEADVEDIPAAETSLSQSSHADTSRAYSAPAEPTPSPIAAEPASATSAAAETEPSEPASTPAPEERDPSIIPIADTPENLWGENWRDGLTEEQIARLESE